MRSYLIEILIFYQQFALLRGNYFGDEFQQNAETKKGPCEDFYEYACSNYTQQNSDPNYSEILQKLDYEMNKKLLRHLNESLLNDDYGKLNVESQTFLEQMKIYFKSCNSKTERDLKKYLNEIKPSFNLNWPLLEHKDKWLKANENFDFWSLLGEMQSLGLNNVIINQQIIRNKDNSLNIWLAPALIVNGGALPHNIILQVILKALGITNAQIIIEQLHATESNWQKMLKKYADYNVVKNITIQHLARLYPHLTLYLQHLLQDEFKNRSLITLENPLYIKFLHDKLWSAEEQKHLCNYLMIKFLFYLAVDSTAEFSPLDCIKDLRNKFDLAVNFYYYQYYFNYEQDKYSKPLYIMLRRIQHTMIKYFKINHLHLSDEQIMQLQTKLKNIKINIGNLPANFDYYKIQDFYREIPNLELGNYYKNHLLLLKHRFRKSLSYAQNQSHYIASDNRLNGQSSPFYVPQQNMIVLPYGSFQPSLFSYQQSILEQLSLFGFILAHELTHAFDSNSLNYNHQGFPLPLPSAIVAHKNFTKSLNCMQQQEPTKAIDERIADLFAVRVVYRTFLEYYNNKDNKDLRKRFFLTLAQFFCGKTNLKFIDHDSDAKRLQLIVKNFRAFSIVFKCPSGSPMHPKIKCRLY